MPKFTVLQTLVDKLNLVTREILTGIPVIRAFSREKHEEERFEEANAKTDKNKPLCQQMHDLYDAYHDADHEWNFRTDHLRGAYAVRQWSMPGRNSYGLYPVRNADHHVLLMITAMSIMLPRANVAALRINDVLKTKVSVTDPENPVPAGKRCQRNC